MARRSGLTPPVALGYAAPPTPLCVILGRGHAELNDVWSARVTQIKSSPVMADDKVIFGSFNGQVDALQKDTGDLVWNISTGDVVRPCPPFSPSAAMPSLQFFASTRPSARQKSQIATPPPPPPPRRHAATPPRCPAPLPSAQIISSPVVDGETVFIGSEDGRLYALKTEDGEEAWSYATKDKVDSSPAVGDSLVYVGSLDGTVHAINKESGESEWEYETDGVVRNAHVRLLS